MQSPERVAEEVYETLKSYASHSWVSYIVAYEESYHTYSSLISMVDKMIARAEKSRDPAFISLIRMYVAALLFLVDWVDPARLDDDTRRSLNMYLRGKADSNLLKRSFKMALKLAAEDDPLSLIDYRKAAIFNFITYMVIDAAVYRFLKGGSEGNRVALAAPIGSGKTSYAFYSGYAALRALGLPEEDAVEITGKLITNDYDYAAGLLRAVSGEDLYIPFLVIDDVASIIGKYWIWSGREERRKAIALMKAIKIGREGVGLILLPTDTETSLPRGIKESVDFVVRGYKRRRAGVTVTLWSHRTSTIVKASSILSRSPWDTRVIDREFRVTVPEAYAGTLHPPLFMPRHIKARLEEVKMKARRRILEEATSDADEE